jgi:hypothetical protein
MGNSLRPVKALALVGGLGCRRDFLINGLPASLTQLRDHHFDEVHRAILAGTARLAGGAVRHLRPDRRRAGGAVGYSARIARRVVQGKEFLNETKVAACFRAMA